MAIVTDLSAVNRDVTDMMTRIYGERLVKIVLFGSYARGDFHDDSDVDYLIVLADDVVSTSREISRLSGSLNAIFLRESIRISAKPVSIRKLESGSAFFTEVSREGITVYERTFSQVY